VRHALVIVFVAVVAGVASLFASPQARAESGLADSFQCHSTIIVAKRTVQCRYVLRNTSDTTLENVQAMGSIWLCSMSDAACCVCLVGSFPLGVASADPTWTRRTNQYSFPVWEPVGSGTLGPGQSLTITIGLLTGHMAGSGIAAGYRPTACMSASSDGASPPLSTTDCAAIEILEVDASATPGDVSCDHNVNSVDALAELQRLAELIHALPCPTAAADVNDDGAVDALDAALILQYVARLIPGLPV
jgi:hypothetical protein